MLLFVILFEVWLRNLLCLWWLSGNHRSLILIDLRRRLLHEALDQVVLELLLVLGNGCIHELLVILDAGLNLLNKHRHQLVTNILVGQ